MMNKKGAGLGVAIIIAIMFFIIGLTAINMITPEVTRTRASDQLNCANASAISDGNKLTCLAVDLVVPYFILIIFSGAGGYITAKFIL